MWWTLGGVEASRLHEYARSTASPLSHPQHADHRPQLAADSRVGGVAIDTAGQSRPPRPRPERLPLDPDLCDRVYHRVLELDGGAVFRVVLSHGQG
jgi:hypothetical protein